MALVKDSDIVKEFQECLEWLRDTDPWEIGQLTKIAKKLASHYADELVVGLEQHISKVPPKLKLPGLYLLDSMVKNANPRYINLFAGKLVNTFSCVFMVVDGKTRALLFTLRKTWSRTFSAAVLYDLDCHIKRIDHNWPIIKPTPPSSRSSGSSRSLTSSPPDNIPGVLSAGNSARNSPVDGSAVHSVVNNSQASVSTENRSVSGNLMTAQRQTQKVMSNHQSSMAIDMLSMNRAKSSGEQRIETSVQSVQSCVSVDNKTREEFSNDEFMNDLLLLNLPDDDFDMMTVKKRKRSDFLAVEDPKKYRTQA